MNNRDYKESIPGGFFHVFNRGNNKEDIFNGKDDFQFFLTRLAQNIKPESKDRYSHRLNLLPPGSFSLISYCLMPNHFHLLLKQNSNLAISSLMIRVCTSYSKYFNQKNKRVGHVFQDQYKQVHVDNNKYLVWLSAYIHQNPPLSNFVKKPENYPWSSHKEYVSNLSGICEKEIILSQFNGSAAKYENFANSVLRVMKNNKNGEDDFAKIPQIFDVI